MFFFGRRPLFTTEVAIVVFAKIVAKKSIIVVAQLSAGGGKLIKNNDTKCLLYGITIGKSSCCLRLITLREVL
jgi:hypothetical protein